MLYAKIRLVAAIERTINIPCEHNYWRVGTEFFITQDHPGYGMVVYDGPDAGLGIQPEAAEIIEVYASSDEMRDAMAAFGD
jgi:hypothetical protein